MSSEENTTPEVTVEVTVKKEATIDDSSAVAKNTEEERQHTEVKTKGPRRVQQQQSIQPRTVRQQTQAQQLTQVIEQPVEHPETLIYNTITTGKCYVEGIKSAWNSAQPEYNEEFNPKNMFKCLLLPSILVIAYYVSPLDVVVDATPVVGTVDDFAVACLLMISGFRKNYYKMTGVQLSIQEIISGKRLLVPLIEHMITSTVQLVGLAGGPVYAVASILLSATDCIVVLATFYKTFFQHYPNFFGQLKGYNNKRKADKIAKKKEKEKKKLLKEGALK